MSINEKSDHELAADARMLAAELSKVSKELVARGVEVDVTTWTDGRVALEINRVTKEVL